METCGPRIWQWAAQLILAAVFVLDLFLELGYAIATLYGFSVWMMARAGSRQGIWMTAAVVSVLSVVSLLLSPPGSQYVDVLANRGLSLVAIWSTTVLCLQLYDTRYQLKTIRDSAIDADARIEDNRRKRRALLNILEDLNIQRTKLVAANKDLIEVNSELEQFAYVASHDLRAPLRGISFAAAFVREDDGDKLSDASLENLSLLDSRIQRMDQLLEDLLAYSRVGRTVVLKEMVDTQELVNEIMDLVPVPDGFQVCCQAEMPTFETFVSPLRQVLLNLISNALKHHGGEAGRIDIGVVERDEFFEFSVADDGAGIDAEYHEQIFEMFRTLQSRDTVEGSGMGLAIIQKLLAHFGGSIRVESTVGQGSLFKFTWPKYLSEKGKS